ncbi:MAG: hypothetical protein HGA65_19400 [Oscillochloris sp.]|nr:hypothetical protein [Oscillochloris sp.]
MSQPPEPEYAASPLPAAPQTSRSTPPRRGCGAQFFSLLGWLITVLLSASLAIAAAAAILFYYFGFNLSTPGEIRQANRDLAALHATSQVFQTEIALLSTTSAEQGSNVGNARERVDDLEAKVTSYEQQAAALAGQSATAAALAQDLSDNITLAATIQADAHQGQQLAAVVATVQAQNASQLDELQRRTDRIARFLQRMSDIANDMASEDAAAVATAQSAAPTAASLSVPTQTPTPTSTPTP